MSICSLLRPQPAITFISAGELKLRLSPLPVFSPVQLPFPAKSLSAWPSRASFLLSRGRGERSRFFCLSLSALSICIRENNSTEKPQEVVMADSRFSLGLVLFAALVFAIFLPAARSQSLAPAPSPSSDGTSIDQGIAYALMLVALALTYLIHSADFSNNL